jgi:hypothetical protein
MPVAPYGSQRYGTGCRVPQSPTTGSGMVAGWSQARQDGDDAWADGSVELNGKVGLSHTSCRCPARAHSH